MINTHTELVEVKRVGLVNSTGFHPTYKPEDLTIQDLLVMIDKQNGWIRALERKIDKVNEWLGHE